MSVETYYKQGEIRKIGAYGSTLKLLVSDLLSLDTMLLLDSVVTDTEDTYSCYLKISDSRLLIDIHNAGPIMSFGYCYLDNSDKIVKFDYMNKSYFTSGGQCCAVVWGIGDCLRYFSFTSTFSSGGVSCGFVYSFFTSETYNKKVYLYSTIDSSDISFPVPGISDRLPSYFYNSELNSQETLSYLRFDPGSAVMRSGYNYTLLPFGYQAFSPTKGFLNITFGDGHKLYQLYNGSTKVTVQVGEMVTINGKQVMSVGPVIYAE